MKTADEMFAERGYEKVKTHCDYYVRTKLADYHEPPLETIIQHRKKSFDYRKDNFYFSVGGYQILLPDDEILACAKLIEEMRCKNAQNHSD